MSSADGPDGPHENEYREAPDVVRQSVELQLFDSLIHHLIEKGVLTKNDALSVVQTVAEVEQGAVAERPDLRANGRLAFLERLYHSYQLLAERPAEHPTNADGNIVQLRPPLHRDRPEFPKDN